MIALDFQAQDVLKGIRGMGKKGKNFSAAWQALRKPLQVDQLEHQKRTEGPSGPWPRYSPKTIAGLKGRPKKRRTKQEGRFKGKMTKRRRSRGMLGKLPKNVHVGISRLGIEGYSPIRNRKTGAKWPNVHQFGGEAGSKRRRAKIPARPFLWVSDRLAKQATTVLLNHVYGGWLRQSLGLMKR